MAQIPAARTSFNDQIKLVQKLLRKYFSETFGLQTWNKNCSKTPMTNYNMDAFWL